MFELEIGEITLSRQEILLIGVVVVGAMIIAQFSINVFRKRQFFTSALLFLVLAAAISYAIDYYRSIHAPEYVAEKALEASKHAGKTLIESNQNANNSLRNFARGYGTADFQVDGESLKSHKDK